jgi:hypothetical protein
MTEEKTAQRSAVTLDLTAQPIHAPATVDEPARPAPLATAGDAAAAGSAVGGSVLDRILELKRLGITNEELREFLTMQREWQAAEAEKAYLRAMAAFKAEGVAEIPKAVHVHYTTRDNKVVDYWHEELADVVAAVSSKMAAFGLTASWVPVQEGRGDAMLISVETVLRHTAGHSERVRLYAAPDSSGGKNSIQAVKSSVSYLERIGFLAILGLAAKGQDNDGRGAAPPRVYDREPGSDDATGGRWPDDPGAELGDGTATNRPRGKPETRPPQARDPHGADRPGVITEKQVGLLVVRLRDKGLDQAEFCRSFGVPSLEDVPRNRMDEALKLIGQQR